MQPLCPLNKFATGCQDLFKMESSRAVVLLALSNCMYDCDGRLQKLAACVSGNQ